MLNLLPSGVIVEFCHFLLALRRNTEHRREFGFDEMRSGSSSKPP